MARFPPPSELISSLPLKFSPGFTHSPQQDALPTPPGTSFTAPLPGYAPLGLPVPLSPLPRPRHVPAPGVRSWGPARTWLRPLRRCSAGKLRGQRRVSRARRAPRPPPASRARCRHVPTLISLGSNLGGMAAADGGDGDGWRRMERGAGQKAFRLPRAAKRQRGRRSPEIYPLKSRERPGNYK